MRVVAALAQRRRRGGSPASPPPAPPPTSENQTVTYTEDTTTDFANPERGWYVESPNGSVGTQTLPSPVSSVSAAPTMELFYVRLDAYRRQDLPSTFLTTLEGWLQQVRSSGRKVAVRFAYNRSGGAEDTSITWMKRHIDQLEPLWNAYQDIIAVLQGGFIGGWGEQSSDASNSDSPGKTQAGRNEFFAYLMAHTPATMMVQWRDPAYYNMDAANYPTPLTSTARFTGTEQARAGHYNDCYLAGYEMVTYWDGNNGYTTEQQIVYTQGIGPFVCMGGETCDAAGLNTYNAGPYSIAMMEDQAWDYLNAAYWTSLYSNWSSNGYLAEISRRLGYRLFLSEATLPTSAAAGATVDVTLRFLNRGFGKVYNARPIDLILVGTGGPFTVRLTADARTSLPLGGGTAETTWSVALPAGLVAGASYSLHLRLPDPSSNLEDDDRYTIRLANSAMWDASNGRHDLGASLSVPA